MKDMLKDIKVEEMLKCFMLIIVGYFIAKLFSKTCNGFNVGGQVGGQVGGKPVPVMCNPKADQLCPGKIACPDCGKDACPCPVKPVKPSDDGDSNIILYVIIGIGVLFGLFCLWMLSLWLKSDKNSNHSNHSSRYH